MKWKLVLGLAVVFCSGTIIGGAGVFVHTRAAVMRVLEGGPNTTRGYIMKKLSHDLQLTDAQKGPIEKVVATIQQQALHVRLRSQPEVLGAVAAGVAEMKILLDTEQQQRLDALHQRIQERANVRVQWEQDLASFIASSAPL